MNSFAFVPSACFFPFGMASFRISKSYVLPFVIYVLTSAIMHLHWQLSGRLSKICFQHSCKGFKHQQQWSRPVPVSPRARFMGLLAPTTWWKIWLGQVDIPMWQWICRFIFSFYICVKTPKYLIFWNGGSMNMQLWSLMDIETCCNLF